MEPIESRLLLAGFDLVLIDSTLPSEADISRAARPGAVVMTFDARSESAAALLARAAGLARARAEPIASLSVVSHGGPGWFELGLDAVSLPTLERGAPGWAALSPRLASGASIYLFGCSVGADEAGRQLIDRLSSLTGAAVFASNNLTGDGGDWTLEVASHGAEDRLGAGLAVPFEARALNAVRGVTLFTAVGSEFRVNSTTSNTQDTTGPSSVAMDHSGNFVVVWESQSQDALGTYGVYAQRYSAAGVAQGGEILVNTTVLLEQHAPAVAMDASGDFVVVWAGNGVLGTLEGINAQRFSAAGLAQGSEFRVSQSLLLTQQSPSVAIDDAGDFVVAWESVSQDVALTSGVYARRYDSAGNALTSEFLVNTTTAGDQKIPQVAMDSGGDFVIAWSGNGTGDAAGIFFQRYNSSGVAQGGETRANTFTTNAQDYPDVAMDAAGNYVVVWSGKGSGDTAGVFAQRFNAAGTAQGAAFLVNTTTAGTQEKPSVACDTAGSFVIVWDGNITADAAGIIGQNYDSTGTTVGSEFLVNTTTAGTQQIASAARADNDKVILVWSGNVPGDVAGVAGQRYDTTKPVLDLDGSSSSFNYSASFTEDGGSVLIEASNATVTDNNNATLASMTVTITNLLDGGAESLSATTAGTTITATYTGATGVLSLTGSDTLAHYQQVLRTVRYNNTSQNPTTTSRAVTFAASDGTETGATVTAAVTITAVNDAPVLTTAGSTLSYTENQGPLAIDPSLTVSDADSANLTGATVRISANYVSGQDALAFTNQLGITSSWNAATGVLTLSGTTTVANYQAALRAVTYTNTSDNPSTLTRTASFVATDGTDPSAAATRSISITAVNDPPVVTATGSTLPYTENAGAVVVDGGLTVTDADSSTLAGATVTISTNYASGQDVLSFTNQLGVTGAWNTGTGVLTLSGTATVANYQAALRAVTYTNTSDNPSTLTRTVSFVATDGSDSSAAAMRSISITAVNDPPVVTTTGSTLSYTENQGVAPVDPSLTVTDADSTNLTGGTVAISANFASGQDVLSFTNQLGITGSWNAGTGVLTLSGTATVASYQAVLRTITYSNTSDNPSTLTRTVAFVVNDGTDPSNTGTRSVSITAVNDPPVVTTTGSALAYTENQGAAVIDGVLTVTDVDSATLSGAAVTISGNYASGEDVLSFTDQPGITGSWNAATGVLTLSGTATVASYQAALRTITYTDTSDNPSTVTRTISFVVNDGADPSATATRDISITSVNDPPVVTTSTSTLSYTENQGAVVVDGALTVTDADSAMLTGATVAVSGNYASGEDALSFTNQLGITGTWNAGTGVLTLTGTANVASYQAALRSITYVNSSDGPSTLTRTISFIASDGTDASNTGTRYISITAVNDPPVVTTTGTILAYTENQGALAVDGGLTIIDADSPTLLAATITITANYASGQDVLSFTDQLGITGTWNAATGALTLSGAASVANYQAALRAITYTNTSDNPGTLTRAVTFVANDGTDPSAGATRDVAVTATNDPPIVTTTGSTLSYTENAGAVVVDAGLTVSDADNANLTGATVTISANYASGEDAVSFTNQLGITGSWNATTGTLTLSGTASVASYQAALRTITYTNASENPSTLTRGVTFVVNDGTDPSTGATRDISIAAVNDPPVVTTTGVPLPYTENAGAVVLDGGLIITDIDSSTLAGATVAISTNFAGGQDALSFTDQPGISGSWNGGTGVLTLTGVASVAAYQAALRTITYTNTSDDPSALTRTVTVVVSDGTDPSAGSTRDISITAVNDPPVVTTTGSTLPYTENAGALAVDVGLTISDADSSTLTGAAVTISGNFVSGQDVLAFTDQLGIAGSWKSSTGVLTLTGVASVASYQAALRSITYTNTSDNPDTATRTVSFVVSDGTDASNAGTRDISITPVNDPPLVTTSSSALSYTEGQGTLVVDGGLTVSDADSSTLKGATVWISTNFATGQDALSFTDQLGITGSWNAATGVLTLSGTASLTNYQTALRSIAYSNTSDDPITLTRTVNFVVNDGTDPSAGATRDIAITAVNDPPVVTTSGSTLSYTENQGAAVIDPLLTVTDTDNVVLAGATVTISANYASGEDVLFFADQSGITGSWNASTGLLTLTGVASVASYQAALRTITYTNTSDNPGTLTRTVTFVVNDGTDPSGGATRNVSVTAVNDPPVVTLTGSTLSYTENAGAVVLDGGLTVADVDSVSLAGATVTISANYASGEDVLFFADQFGITGSWSGSTGVLTLTGVASIASYQAALRTITYTNTSDNPSTLTRTVTFVVSDGTDPSAAATRSASITAVNDPPVVATTASTLSYTENQGAAFVDAGLTVSDVDSASLTRATVTISANYVSGQDVLAFTTQLGISGSWNASTGTLTLTGVASVASYQAALRSITYTNTSDNPGTLTRTVSFTVSDGSDPSNAGARDVSVAAVNDPPTVTTTGSTLPYTENQGPLAVDAGLVLADPDSAALAGATVWVSAGYVTGQDVLSFTGQIGITGSWSAATGVLTLSGVASLAGYQTALRSITYTNLSDDPSTLARSISFIVSDGNDPSAAASRAVAVNAVNDPPVVTTTGTTLPYTENQGAAAIDPGLTLADADSPVLAGGTVAIAANYASGQDVLVFASQLGITGSWNAATGVLTLTGNASLADYRTALRSVAYINLSDNPVAVLRTIAFVVDDGTDVSGAATRDIAVVPVNDPPVVTTTGSPLSYAEGQGALPVDGGLTIADPDSAVLVGASVSITGNYAAGQDVLSFTNQSGITGSWDAPTGTLTLSGAATVAAYQAALRSVMYINTSANPGNLTRTVTFVTSDGTDASVAATRFIAIGPADNPPVVTTSGTPLTYTENQGPAVADGGVSVSDSDSATLAGATVAIAVNFAPGQDVLSFTDQSGITGSWNAATGVLTMAGPASVADYQSALRSIVFLNLSDNPSVLTRTLAFVVNDGTSPSAAAGRAIVVTSVNDAPVLAVSGGSVLYTENQGATAIDPGLMVSDVDSANLAGAIVSIAANFAPGEDVLVFTNGAGITGSWDGSTGTLTLSGVASVAAYQAALRSVAYMNTSDNPGDLTRTVRLVVTDGADASAPAGRDVTVARVNDAPVVTTTSSVLTYLENQGALSVDAGLTVSDVDSTVLTGATLRISANYAAGQDLLSFASQGGITGSWDSATGTLTLSGAASVATYQAALRTVAYTNTSDNPSALPRAISLVVSDGIDASTVATRTISVTAANDTPIVTGTGTTLTYTENQGPLMIDTGLSISDQDSATLASAAVTISANYAGGQDTLVFVTQPGITGSWDAGTGTLTLTGAATLAAYQAALRSVAYVNASDNPSTLTRAVTLVVSDGTDTSAGASYSIAVVATNDSPVVGSSSLPLSYTENEGAVPVDAAFTVSDADSAVLTGAAVAIAGNYAAGQDVLSFADQFGITGVWDAASGGLTLSGVASVASYQAALRSVTYTNTSENPRTAARAISIVVSDGTTSASATRTVTVTAVNDPPVARTIAAAVTQGQNLPISLDDLASSATDPDSTGLFAQVVSGPSHGTLAVRTGGVLVYTPAPGFVGADSFTYAVSDGSAWSIPASFRIDVVIPGASAAPPAPPIQPPPPIKSAPSDAVRIWKYTGIDTPSAPPPASVPGSTDAPPTTTYVAPADAEPQATSSIEAPKPAEDTAKPPDDAAQPATAPQERPVPDSATEPTEPASPVSTVPPSAHPALEGPPRAVASNLDRPIYTIRAAELSAMVIESVRQADAQVRLTRTVAGAAAACTVACTAGYVVWTIHSGALLASYVSGLPAVQGLDPLPVLEFAEARAAARRRGRRAEGPDADGDIGNLAA